MKQWDDAWKTDTGRANWLEPAAFVTRHLPALKAEGVRTVLDLGCGPGRHAIYAAKLGFYTVGYDAAPSGVEFARQWAAREHLDATFQVGDMGALPFADRAFDCIISWNVVYHGTADVVARATSEIERCLRPGGTLMVTLISKWNERFGMGREIEPDTFVVEGSESETSHPHRFYGREDAADLLAAFDIVEAAELTQATPGSYHWEILARRR